MPFFPDLRFPGLLIRDSNRGNCVSFRYPGLETMLPLLLTAVHDGRLRVQDIREKLHDNPKRIFQLPDQPDTYVEVDMDEEWTIPEQMAFSKAHWTPFAGLHVRGKVHRVVVRGEDAYLEGQVLAKPGFGRDVRSEQYLDAVGTVRSAAPAEPYQNGWSTTSSHARDVNVGDVPRQKTDLGVAHRSPGYPDFTSPKPFSSLDITPTTPYDYTRTVSPMLVHASDNLVFPQNIITVDHFNKALVDHICSVAELIKAAVKRDKPIKPILKGKIMASMFYEVSTRTMNSFAAAMQRCVRLLAFFWGLIVMLFSLDRFRLGGSVVYLDPASSSVQKGESLEDSVTVMSSYVDVVVMRHPEPGAAVRAAKCCLKPFINAGDGVSAGGATCFCMKSCDGGGDFFIPKT
jgi:carbamoyl-phosphate synthase / aspartate carbamoyltransferase / dihydroorotase